MNFLKVIFKIIMYIVIAVIIFIFIVGSLVYFSDPNKYKGMIVQKFQQETGQQLILQGPIKITLIPLPHINLTNASMVMGFGDNKVIVAAKSFQFDLEWDALFDNNQRTIKAIKAENASISIMDKNKITQKFFLDSVSGEITHDEAKIQVTEFILTSGNLILQGNATVDYTSTPVIRATLKSSPFKLESSSSDLLALIYSDWLKSADIKIDLQTDSANIQGLELQKPLFKLVFQKTLTVQTTARISQGDLNAKLVIPKKGKSPTPDIDAKFHIKAKNSNDDLQGDLKLNFSEKATKVSGSITTPQWTIGKPDSTAPHNKIFSIDPYDLPWFSKIAGTIDFNTKWLIFNKIKLGDAKVKIILQENSMIFQPTGKIAQGYLNGNITIVRAPQSLNPKIDLNITVKNANATEFLKIFHPQATLNKGTLDLNFVGGSQGKHEAAFMGNLSGQLRLHIRNMVILNERIDARFVDIFAAFWKRLLPTKKNTLLECGALSLDFRNGLARGSKSVGLETAEVYALGGGSVDLKSEQLNMTFSLSPRSKINLEIGSFTSTVFLKGTLSHPVLSASSQGLIQEGGSVLLGYATGGISVLVEKLMDVVNHQPSPCKQVLASQ